MTNWRPALLALLAWTVHFFLAYGLMLAFPQAGFVGWLTLGLGLACLAFLGWSARRAARGGTLMATTIIAALAIGWQSLVVFFD